MNKIISLRRFHF